MKIMLVDDSRTIRKIQNKTLAQLGYTDVAEAADGVQALSLYKERQPDLMLIDWNREEGTGKRGRGQAVHGGHLVRQNQSNAFQVGGCRFLD